MSKLSTQPLEVKVIDDQVQLAGRVTVQNVEPLFKQLQPLVMQIKKVECSALQQVDSSFLALLLWWVAEKKQQGVAPILQLISPPEFVKTLLQLYDLHNVIEVK